VGGVNVSFNNLIRYLFIFSIEIKKHKLLLLLHFNHYTYYILQYKILVFQRYRLVKCYKISGDKKEKHKLCRYYRRVNKIEQ